MVTRTIMNNFNSSADMRLYEDLVNEFVQTWGIDVYYIPRDSKDPNGFDLLFGDDPVKKYIDNYIMEMYIQTVDGFEGSEIFSKFGLIVKKQIKFLLPNRAFLREAGSALSRPREGDLLWLSNFKALFEIKYVDEEHFFYDFGKTDFYAFSLTCEKFRYNDETITTTNPEITSIVNTLIATYNFYLANTGNTGTYMLGEPVYQTDNNAPTGNVICGGTVNTWNLPTGILQLNTINGVFLQNNQIFGANSHASWTLVNSDMLNNINNPMMNNEQISSEANTVLNWTEQNPFGDT